MPAGWLADLVLLSHLAFVIFVGAGGLLVLRWPRLLRWHLAAVAWGAGIEITGWTCPLTPLENHLRQLTGDAGYAGDFIGHLIDQYVTALIYPEGLTRPAQAALGTLAIGLNAAVYGWMWRTRRGPFQRRPVHQ